MSKALKQVVSIPRGNGQFRKEERSVYGISTNHGTDQGNCLVRGFRVHIFKVVGARVWTLDKKDIAMVENFIESRREA